MSVPSIIPASLRFRKVSSSFLLAVVLVFVTNFGWAKGPEPAQRIPLAPLGFQTPLTQFMLAGSSMLTVDFVDPKHLLFTFSSKRLLKRLPECPPADQDRVVEALLLELPSGRILATTSWRTHDHGQYLWNLGRGRFMLRVRDTLSTFAPMANLSKGDAFAQLPLLRTDRRIGGILLSPDADLVIIETVDSRRPDDSLGDETKADDKPVQINFFRMISLNGGEIEMRPGGALRSRVPGRIPANAAGYIAILDQGRQRWSFDFRSYGGKTKELAGFDSTCRPSPMLVSSSEFLAFGCHLSHTPQILGAFNLRGEEMWEQNMTESYVSPTFSYAPGSGRFALSRVLTRSSIVDSDSVTPELFDGQVVVVYQTDSGRQLLRVDAAPIARAGQNYALSPDGMSVAVVRDEAIEIFSLPPLTQDEQKAVQLAEASAPPIDGDPSLLLSSGESSTPAPGPSSGSTAIPSSSPTPRADSPATGSAPKEEGSSSSQDGTPPPSEATKGADTEPSGTGGDKQGTGAAGATASPSEEEPQPRRPPTLYAPGEKPDDGSGKESPKKE
ncbi:MAG TPA: hypothetical protein VGG95_06260 [Edaphobacter sp.]|jgi:hypothetical protein